MSGVVGTKPIWVTETGWPATGPNWDQAVASVDNAKYYWQEVGCRKLFNKVPTFWYNLRDSNPDNTMKFAITSNLSTTPLFDLTCPTTFDTPTAVPTSSTPAATGASTGVSSPASSSTGASNSTTTIGSGASTTSLPAGSGAYLGKSLSAAAVASLALVAGVFALF